MFIIICYPYGDDNVDFFFFFYVGLLLCVALAVLELTL